ncbi:MAG: hypothetical protein SFW66_08855 [Gammaproteobacteria bacterium]|nr:hypothetical protein [Gammaproteobacteria bacterium]
MNLGQIRTKARRKLDEDTARFWSDDELNDYINQGYFFLWQKYIDAGNRKAETSTLLSLVANTREVALPSDFNRARLLEHLVGDLWIPCTFYERYDTMVSENNASDVGDQEQFCYHFQGDNLILEPTPNSDETDTLRLTYFFMVSEMDDDADVPELESIYHDILTSYCCVQAKEKEEMITGNGADLSPFVMTYEKQLSQFINNIQLPSQQRVYAQPFGYW